MFTVEYLKSIGMDEQQIKAIMATQAEKKGQHTVEVKDLNENPPTPDVVPLPYHYQSMQPVPKIEELKITSISDLHAYGQGKAVRLPDFAEGQPFVARLRRPSMLVLAKQGKIPNSLLASANTLFNEGGGGLDADNLDMLKDVFDVCEIIAKAALMEPTYDDIKNAGMELSDNQLMAIFSYTQNGIKALDSFR